tara:strand:+ start:761 stop:1204 length:444 start_codon:yes stop_codon:yes gene_type:complete
MRYIIIFILFNKLIFSITDYENKKITTMLQNYCVSIKNFPEVLGIHIYENKQGKILQLDIEYNDGSDIITAMEAMSKSIQYSKTHFDKFIVITHYPEFKLPIGYESDVKCALNYFIKNKINEKYWKKDCLKEGVLNRKIDNWSPINK